jgi:hypothetical protein
VDAILVEYKPYLSSLPEYIFDLIIPELLSADYGGCATQGTQS